MSTHIYTRLRQVLKPSAVDAITGKTFPATNRLTYTNAAAVKTLATDDDASNNITDWGGKVRSATFQIIGAAAKYAYGIDPTTSVGMHCADGSQVEIDMEQLADFRFIPATGTSVVTIQLWG